MGSARPETGGGTSGADAAQVAIVVVGGVILGLVVVPFWLGRRPGTDARP